MKLYHRLFALLLCCALLVGSLTAFAAASPREDALRFLLQQAREPSAGDTYGDWEIFALARSGGAVADGYYAAWLKRVDRVLAENGGKLTGPVTGNLRLMLSLLALDRNLSDVGGYDLTAIVKDSQRVCRTAVMGPVFGILILKNTGGDPAAEQAYLQHLLDKRPRCHRHDPAGPVPVPQGGRGGGRHRPGPCPVVGHAARDRRLYRLGHHRL